MHKSRLAVIVVLTLFLVASAGWAARIVEDYTETINNFKDSSDVAPFFDTAYGYAVFPNIGRGGLGSRGPCQGQAAFPRPLGGCRGVPGGAAGIRLRRPEALGRRGA